MRYKEVISELMEISKEMFSEKEGE